MGPWQLSKQVMMSENRVRHLWDNALDLVHTQGLLGTCSYHVIESYQVM